MKQAKPLVHPMRAFERQPGESAKAFEAWQVYRDTGSERSVSEVARQLAKSRQLVDRWAQRHDWHGRVQAFENWKQMIRMDALEGAERKRAEDFAERERALDERILFLKEKLVRKMEQMLRFPLTVEKIEHEDEDGEEKIIYIHPARWSFDTIVRALVFLDKTSRRLDVTAGEETFTFTLDLGDRVPKQE